VQSPPILIRMQRIALLEFPEIISSSHLETNKLRFFLIDNSFLEIYCSLKEFNQWAFHWERRNIDGTFYRYDNIPHLKWKEISTFPWHFHTGNGEIVEESSFGDDRIENLRTFFCFIQENMQ